MPWGFTILGFNNLRTSLWEATILRGFLGLVPLTHFFRARMRRANCTNATAAQSSKQLECSGYQQQAAAKEVPKCPHKLRRSVKTEKGTRADSMEFVCIQLNVFYPSQCIFSGPGDACEGIGSLVVMKPLQC